MQTRRPGKLIKESMVGKQKILLFDEDPDCQNLQRLLQEQPNYETTLAGSAGEAITLAQAQRFDLVILHKWLADDDAYSICKQLRKFDSRTPVLFFARRVFTSDTTEALALGGQAYCAMPETSAELVAAVEQVLGRVAETAPVLSTGTD